jgi:nitrite reductase/ring-hydroxylating ferredoxin subunit
MTRLESPGAPDAETFLGAAITASGVATRGPVRIPVERYLSTEFAARERERLWPRVWLIACSVDHVAEPGDHFEFRTGSYSVIVVRGDDGVLRAFQNACRHRGNALCTGAGQGLTELRCGYHFWTWDLRGRLREVPSRKGFGGLRNDDFPLIPVNVDTWGPLVFVNLDPEAVPLAEYLEGVPDDIAWSGIEEFACTYTTVTPVPANWKVVTEGFSETYHVQGLHREMLGCFDDIESGQRLWGLHGVSYQPYGVPSPRLGRDVPDQVVWDSFVLTQGGRLGPGHDPGVPMPPVPAGMSAQHVIAEGIRRHQAERGVDLTRFDDREMLLLSQYNLFPNATVLVSSDLFTVLAAQPGPTPGESSLVTMHFARRAPSAPAVRPVDAPVPLAQADFGFVLNADFHIIETVQLGLGQPGLTHLALSSEECRVINLHRNLSRYLDVPDPTAGHQL